MPTNQRRRTRAVVVAALVVVCASVAAVPTLARAAAADKVKFYEVAASYANRPESLSAIAFRFLGSAKRSTEIFDLNVGRTQPDGKKLTDGNSLEKGWLLVLPWDAVGDGVRYGELPKSQPVKAVATPTGVSASSTPAVAGPCAGSPKTSNGSGPWAQLRLAPQQAWSRGRGDGVTVAVIDSGVDASLPQLSDRVAVGADIVSGSGRGNTDCLGSGTAMAVLIAGQSDSTMVGIAPGATILPIRVVTDRPSAKPADQASAIDVAVSAGAGVIALGSFVNVRQPEVDQAVTRAASHDVVVVVGASAVTPLLLPNTVLRVGAMGIDGKLGAAYAPGGVDVIAPGVNVTSLGINGTGEFHGTGTQYAVAFVAGEAALLRSTYKSMSSVEVVHQIRRSASPLGAGVAPDPVFGWGLIDLAKATSLRLETPAPSAAPTHGTKISTSALVISVVVALIIAGLLIFRLRRAVRSGTNVGGQPPTTSPPDNDAPPHDGPPGLTSTLSTGSLSAGLSRRTSSGPSPASDGATSSRPMAGLSGDTEPILGSGSSYGGSKETVAVKHIDRRGAARGLER